MMRNAIVFFFVLALGGCGNGGSSEPAETETTSSTGAEQESLPGSGETERPLLTPEECTAQGGTVVGDIGDGATHRPDYICPSGSAPLGNVPLGIEGSVCCPS